MQYPEGARALVTGALSGLGAACVARLRSEGVEVLTLDMLEGADLVLDISDESAVVRAGKDAGPVDVLVNAAGIVGPNQPLSEISLADWRRTFQVNVEGTFLLCREFVPQMAARGWGRVVNFSSIAGRDGNALQSAYSASKAAVIALTRSLAKEHAQDGVLVNAIVPSAVRTPMNADTDPRVLEQSQRLTPMRRFATPEEVAALVSWLCSSEMSFSTGAAHDISGGRATF